MNSRRQQLLASFAFFTVLLLGLTGLGVWAFTSQIEESVSGQGEIVPEGKYRHVRAPIGGVIVESLAKENESVKAGQVLFKLNPRSSQIDASQSTEQLALLQQEAAAVRAAWQGNQAPLANATTQNWLEASRVAHESRMANAQLQVEKARHQLQESRERLHKTQQLLNTDQQQLANYKALHELGGLSTNEYTEFEKKVITLQGELAIVNEEIEARTIALQQAEQDLQALESSYQETMLERLNNVEKQLVAQEHQSQKISFNQSLELITSPIHGIIHQQIVRGAGDVVAAGETLLMLVPKNARYVAEIKVKDRDLGYIHPDQEAYLRLEAFPYQKFGRLKGYVETISPSTTKDDDGNPYYIVRIRPERQYFEQDGEQLSLKAGMTVSTDMVTRHKSILSFFTEAFRSKTDRAFRDPTTR